MKLRLPIAALALTTLFTPAALAQVTVPLPGRSLNKLLPDYSHPRVYALNQASGSVPGTLLALNSTNGAILNEISVNLNPTDMAMSPAGDALYVINAGSRTISKVALTTFAVVAEQAISTPNTYSLANPLHLAVGRSNLVYFTDGAWAPSITTFDYANGTNVAIYDDGNGTGGLTLTRNGQILYRWRQYGWGAGNVNSWVTRYDALTNANLTPLEDSFTSWRRDPTDTPVFLDAAERWVFNKQQMFAATNVSILLNQFADNIYGVSLDGSVAFGPTEVFNTANGMTLTNLPFSTTVQSLSGDQKRLFRYNASTTNVVIYDMATIAPVSGPSLAPTPADGSVVGLPPTNLSWTVSPIALGYDVYFGTNQAQVAAATSTSIQHLGRVSSPGWSLGQTLTAGATYYWRVDVAGFSVTNAGPVWSFTVSPLAVNPPQVPVGAIASFNPAPVTLSLTSSATLAWTAGITGANWLTLSANSGTSPSTLTLSFNTAALAAGLYTNVINVTNGPFTVQVPVTLDIKPLNLVKMATDYQRPYIYAIQAPALSGQNGQLLFINTTTEAIEKTLPIGFNPVDLTVHYGEDRLYIASWTENTTYVVDLTTQTLLPPLHLGTDVYKINAGKPGQLITEGEDQWIYSYLINTADGSILATAFFREGDGEFDPTGRYYYHSDNNISGAGITKYDMSANSFVSVAGAAGHSYYGSRNVVMSPDGSRVFWTGAAYDANLNDLGYLGEEIYGTTAHGDLALGGQHVFNSHSGQILYTWPFSTSILAVSGDQKKVFLYNSTTLQLSVIPMSAIASVPGPGLNPIPTDGAVINPPLSQVSWTPSPFALSYRVFMGTNLAAVASANTNSAPYLGTTLSNAFSLSGPVNTGLTYYWRVDSVGFSTIATGAVWSFTVSSVTVSPQTLSLMGVVGLPILPQSISIAATLPVSWTMSIAQPWVSASATNGTTPSSVTLNFNTTNLAAGYFTNQLTFSANGTVLQLLIVVQLFDLNASKIAVDPNRNCLYVLHPGTGNFNDAFLLFLNTDTGVVEKVIPIGINPTDLTVNRFEDRLYVSNWQHNQTRVVDLVTRTELAPLALGTDVYKINAGKAGRVITEGEDQWIGVNIVDTATGSVVGSMPYPERQGDGEADATGTVYYHSDDNISNAHVHKFQLAGDTATEVGGSPEHPYGSRNLVLAPSGTRLFWRGYVYDANLNELGGLGAEIYSCSTNGSVAFSDQQAFDTVTRQVVFSLPVTSAVSAVDRMDQRLWYFNGSTHQMESIPLAVIRTPSITQQPAATTSVGVGGNVYLSVTAMGVGTLSYQWTLAATNLPGSTNYFLSMNAVQPPQQGDYQVVVSNPFGVVTSAVAHVTVLVAPTITGQPQSTNVFAGQSFSLSATATGSIPLNCQWSFEGVNLAGATNSTLAVSNAQAANEGVFRAVICNGAGCATSAVARVRVLPAAPTIAFGPASATVPAASNVNFTVSAVGSQPLSYQWLLNGTPVSGATASQYSIIDAQSWHTGNYQVAVTNGFGAVTSMVATLTVTPVAPYFRTQPLGATLPVGTNFTLIALAGGSEPIGYQWRHDNADLAGANQASLTLTNLQLSGSGGYSVVAFSVAGTATSLVASVVVTAAPPVFVQQPGSVAVLAGSSTTLNSLATGSAPLQYRWYFQNGSLLNQTNRQLTLSSIAPASAGLYYVTASNTFAVATSAVAQVTVNQSPVLQQPLTNYVADVNSTVTLTVNALGNPTLAYSWQFNGQPIAAAGPTLTLTNLQLSQAGFYRFTITNQFGSVSSTGRVSVLGWPSPVVAWGDDSEGQTNVPANLNDIVAVAGGDFHTLALHHDGSLVAWGYNGDGQTTVPANPLRFVSVAAGAAHNLAILENGSVVAWGRNDAGQRNVPTSATNGVLAVAAGDAHSLALLASGSVVAWGDNTFGQSSVPQGLGGVRAIAAGRNHGLALRSNGVVVGWGFNTFGQASPPALTNAMAIAAGYLHSAALLSNGTVVVWGDNTYGQANVPSGLTNLVAIAAGDFHTLALRADGTVVGWGDDSYRQIDLPSGLVNVWTIACGNYHSLVLTSPPGSLQPSLVSKGLVVRWTGPGTLQWAPTPVGPYRDVGCQGTCYTNLDMTAPAKFFRLRR